MIPRAWRIRQRAGCLQSDLRNAQEIGSVIALGGRDVRLAGERRGTRSRRFASPARSWPPLISRQLQRQVLPCRSRDLNLVNPHGRRSSLDENGRSSATRRSPSLRVVCRQTLRLLHHYERTFCTRSAIVPVRRSLGRGPVPGSTAWRRKDADRLFQRRIPARCSCGASVQRPGLRV